MDVPSMSIQVNQMLLDQGIGVFRIGTVYSWLSEAHGSTGIHENLKRLGICDIQQPIAKEEEEEDDDDDDDGTKKMDGPILKYTPKTGGGISVSSEEKSFRSIHAAAHLAFRNLGFHIKYTKVSSLKMDLIANNGPLESDSFMDVSLSYKKVMRSAAFCSLYVIVKMSEAFILPQAESLAKSISYTLPGFVMDNADFIDGNLLNKGSKGIITTVSQIQNSLFKTEYACLGFVGYSGHQKSFAGYLSACGVSDADRKIELMQKRALYYQSPLGQDVPWCRHVFTQALLENAMKRAMNSEGNVAFRARAYLLKHSRMFRMEEERKNLENDLNMFLLHKLKGGEAVPGLQVVNEGSGDWVDLTYPSKGSENPKDNPRNLMIGEMMKKLGLKSVSRPRKKTGFHNRTVMKNRVYFDDQCDIEAIPFLYRYMPEKKQYFLLVAIKK
ncbi:hypothetical protein PSENEW3_00006000 [Picochlorum sp. SENEW3]|nr:hypothetical protein PSENEW3_00006000 [Picochlorum sp. SENEW3]